MKVFSATKAKEREELGETVTRWLRSNADLEVVDRVVTQSSDDEFHCLTIVLFYRPKARLAAVPLGVPSSPGGSSRGGALRPRAALTPSTVHRRLEVPERLAEPLSERGQPAPRRRRAAR